MNNLQLIAALKLGAIDEVQYRPRGNSMRPLIHSGQLVTLKPCDGSLCEKGDIVFCKVNGNYLLHKVWAMDKNKGFLIGNASGKINGWTKKIFGIVMKVEN